MFSNPDQVSFQVRPVGRVESPLTDRQSTPRQADEGAPPATLVFDPRYVDALRGLRPGDRIILLTWLDQADRTTLVNHPRGDTSRPQQGVFSTRSPHRPNPIGLHETQITKIDGPRVHVQSLEAFHNTPILDVKGILNPDITQR